MTDFSQFHFSQKLTQWYEIHKRDLPWRNTTNPYYIWLSEIILQQTRVVQGMPYYYKFVEAFPTVFDLAAADEAEVLRLWQGLGYYSRARNLHKTAKMVVDEYDGVFPDSYQELLKLKGVGSYTAAAIASFSYNEPVAVLDGNVYRVLSRVFGIETDIASNEAKKVYSEYAQALLPTNNANTHNQAIMEFGAMQCTPGTPSDCMFCIFANECVAHAQGRQAALPIKSKKVKVKERFFHYFLLEQNEKFVMRKRVGRDVWEGMYDFYLLEPSESSQLDDLLDQDHWLKEVISNAVILNESENFTHVLTHQKIQTKFWHIRVNADFSLNLPENHAFYNLSEVDDLPKSTLVNNYLTQESKILA